MSTPKPKAVETLRFRKKPVVIEAWQWAPGAQHPQAAIEAAVYDAMTGKTQPAEPGSGSKG